MRLIVRVAGEASLAQIMPSLGPELGGTVVQVNGAGFIASTLFACRFGSDSAASVMFVSSTRVLCTAPPGTGAAKIEIAINGQDVVPTGRYQFHFHYHGACSRPMCLSVELWTLAISEYCLLLMWAHSDACSLLA